MKQVAFLLRGAISKVTGAMINPSSLYSKSPYVDFKSCHRSIQKHIVDVNPEYKFDFFIQSWNTDLQNDLISLYSPVNYIFENNDDYKDNICALLKKSDTDLSYYSNLSQLLSIKIGCELVEQYINKTNKTYDMFIIYRPDLLLWKNMYLNKYDLSKIYCNNNAGSNTGDFHFVMGYNNFLKFKNIYHAVSADLKPIHHKIIPDYMNTQKDTILVPDEIRAGFHQEVIRKLNSLKSKTPYLVNILSEYGLTEAQINSYSC
jgi:hypothetical protein